MRFMLKLAHKFLLSRESDQFLSFISWISVWGISLGVLTLVIVTCVINGFQGELSSAITGLSGDLVMYSRGDPIKDFEAQKARLLSIEPKIAHFTPSLIVEIMAGGEAGVSGAILEGVDWASVGEVTAIPKRVIEGSLPQAPNEAVIGHALAEKLGVKVGGEIRLILPFVAAGDDPDSAAPFQPKAVPTKIVGLVKLGMYEYDSKYIFTSLSSVQEFTDQKEAFSAIKMKLGRGVNPREASDKFNNYLGFPLRTKDWSQFNRNLFYAIELEKIVISIILTLIIVVAAFNVVSTLMMMIHDKTKEIAILKAMGLRQRQCFSLFNVIGVGIGFIGTTLGIGLGLAGVELIKRVNIIHLPADIYPVDHLPVIVRWQELAVIGVAALLISFVATLYPAWNVTRTSPLTGLRYE